MIDTVLAECNQPPHVGAPDANRSRPERESLEDIGAAPNPSIEQNRDLAPNSLDDLGQALDRRKIALLLAPAVVRPKPLGRG